MKEFKYTKRNNDNLSSSQISILSQIHTLAKEAHLSRQKYDSYIFPDIFSQTRYELLLNKLLKYTKALEYRKNFHNYFTLVYDTPYSERIKAQWKSSWKQRQEQLSRQFPKFKKGNSLYRSKKRFYKNIHFDRPFYKYNRYGYVDFKYKYDTRGYKYRKYRVDNNNNFESYLDE